MVSIQSWFKAFRVHTLPLSISGVLVGTFLPVVEGEVIDMKVGMLAMFTAILLQVLSNLANDYGDAVSGVDSNARPGPLRTVQSGLITKKEMKNALIMVILLTLFFGILLIMLAFPRYGWVALFFITLGIAGIFAALKYTMGKKPYGYFGYGDLFVFLFFGLVAVLGSYYLQSKHLEWSICLPAMSIGLFSAAVLNLNNIRDIESDKLAGKYSIPVRIGKQKSAIYHTALVVTGMLTPIFFCLIELMSWVQFIFIFSYLFMFKNIQVVYTKQGSTLNPYLKKLSFAVFVFAILFVLGQIISIS